jgi:hypothetical protein
MWPGRCTVCTLGGRTHGQKVLPSRAPFLALCEGLNKEHNRPTEPEITAQCNLYVTTFSSPELLFPYTQDVL